MTAHLAVRTRPDETGELVAACLAAKRSANTQAAYLRDMAQWAGWLARHGVPLLEADETAAACGPGTWMPAG